jgi:L-asparagine transporter-like permease
LLGSIVTLAGFLLTAIKVLIVVIFLAVVTMIVFSILRDRSRRRQEATDI